MSEDNPAADFLLTVLRTGAPGEQRAVAQVLREHTPMVSLFTMLYTAESNGDPAAAPLREVIDQLAYEAWKVEEGLRPDGL